MTLPVPAAGATIGFVFDDTTGTVTVAQHAAELIYAPVAVGVTRGVASIALVQPNSSVDLISDGTNWYVIGLSTPRTLLYAQVTANQNGITTATDLTGLSGSVTVASGRRIRITGDLQLQNTVATDLFGLTIQEGATVLQTADCYLANNSYTTKVPQIQVVLTPSGGIHAYKITLARIAGTGSCSLNAGVLQPASLTVEDIT